MQQTSFSDAFCMHFNSFNSADPGKMPEASH